MNEEVISQLLVLSILDGADGAEGHRVYGGGLGRISVGFLKSV